MEDGTLGDRNTVDLVRLELHHPQGSTVLLVGPRALQSARDDLSAWCVGRRVFLVSSAPLRERFEDAVAAVCAAARATESLEVPDGEAAKTVSVAAQLWQEMLERGGKRDSRLVTVGGGSMGDLGGFAAACFLRGIEYSQIPTTLLAQVDASIGGKTGIDLPRAKNSVGAFHHPAMVIADTSLLSSLPAAELRSGLVEVIKMAALLDPDLLELVEETLDSLVAGDVAALAPVVTGAIRAKIRVVEEDPEEGDTRRLLNFGHTLGHALESVLEYEQLRHGEAVAYGILFALRLAGLRGPSAEVDRRLRAALARLGLPPLPEGLLPADLIAAMQRDKKVTEAGAVWVLPVALGEGRMDDSIGWERVEQELDSFLRDPLA